MNETETPERPPVVLWYNVYLVVNTLMYLVLALASAYFIFQGESFGVDSLSAGVYGTLALVLFFPLALVHLVPFVLKPSPRAWWYGMMIIVLGLTGCLFPANIALMYYWAKAETKRYYGKMD